MTHKASPSTPSLLGALLGALVAAATPGRAQPPAMPGMAMPGMTMPAPPPAAADDAAPVPDPMAGMNMAGMAHGTMRAMLGPYAMTREASGTSWQPESAPMLGSMVMAGDWQLMAQAYATAVYDRQGGARGDDKALSQSMAMLMANRAMGAGGVFGVRAMVSLDPLMGKRGYPLLFATGETADGRTELVDRQHPHDFVMELAASYARPIASGLTASLYAGLPGEPALGPPAFMHRLSGFDNPEAPIGHHWFDSTHITFGVVTAGLAGPTWKIEASAFKGREPDQHRWDVETPRLDSWAVRAFWNPTRDLSFQLSTGHLHSPEQLHADEDEQRTTASASWNRKVGAHGNWATTIAWSLKDQRPGSALHGLLAETSLRTGHGHIVFARAEREDENELFASGPLHDTIIKVAKLSLGYGYEFALAPRVKLTLGGLASAYAYPARIAPAYGKDGVKSVLLFSRVRFGD